MNKLYEQRQKNGDFVFEVKRSQPPVEIMSHSHILKSRSQFFRAMLHFHEKDEALILPSKAQRIVITKYSPKIIEEMVRFFYLGECEVNSEDLVDLFELCQEFILTDLKQLLEQAMIKNVDLDNFEDTLVLARHFECHQLKQAMLLYAQKHYNELYRRGMLKTLTKQDFEEIKQR
mmetsp:Transcript_40306/g.38778  ORF Transcript_40306/g.38778 Transcript_40306/m.38778 type:complete len:175 (-) Transcript_40306:32-556(-)